MAANNPKIDNSWKLDISWLLELPDTPVESWPTKIIGKFQRKLNTLVYSDIILGQEISNASSGLNWETPATLIANSDVSENVKKFYRIQLIRKMLRAHWRKQMRGYNWPFSDEVEVEDFGKVYEITPFTELDFLEAKKLATNDISSINPIQKLKIHHPSI